MGASSNSISTKNEVSFKCTYNVKNTIDYETIIGHKQESKIKILNGNKKEEFTSIKKFDKIGINTVDFIIERKLNDMRDIFFNCKSLIKVEFISIDTSKVTNMKRMFNLCDSIEYLDLSNFNTSNVETMKYMFSGCSKLKEIKGINNFNTSKLKDMREMFYKCESLEYLDLSNFDTSNVEDMFYMFYGCHNLKEIKGITNFNTSKVKNMAGMFSECKSLEYLDLSKFNTFKVKNMGGMFHWCNSLEYLDLSNFDTSNTEDMNYMFNGCHNLKEIKGITNFNTSNLKYLIGMLDGCDELDYLIIEYNKIYIDEHKLISKIKTMIAVMFKSADQQINLSLACNNSDKFSIIEEKLFNEFPELKSKNIYYLANGNTVNKTSTLKQNKIKNGDTILINYIDDYN